MGKVLERKSTAKGPWKKLLDEFPHNALPNGACEHLDVNNQCRIYEDRPLICRVEALQNVLHPEMSKAAYFAATAEICKELMRKAGYDEDEITKIYSDISF